MRGDELGSDGGSSRLGGLGTRGAWRAAYLPLLGLTVFGLGLAVLLIYSPLNELPDTYCQTVAHPPVGDGCSAVTSRRWRWIGWVLGAAVLCGVVALLTRRRSGRRRMSAPRVGAVALLVLAFALAMRASGYLTVGENHEMCGSTLSRVDEHGLYDPNRPKLCASSYADSRAAAWRFGLLGLAVFVAATGIEVRAEARVRRDRVELAATD